jgi:hypothetical protein
MINSTGPANFLATMDLDLPISSHVLKALHDARVYNWDDDTIRELVENIKNVYRSKGHYVRM